MRILDVQQLSKSFGGLKAVNNLSLEARQGEILGIIGPNGAGKTTLFNLLSGFLKPDKGTISVFGKDITGLKPHEVCKLGLSRTFQIVKPFGNLSVLHNIMVGAFNRMMNRSQAEEFAKEVIQLVRLDDKSDYPANTLNIGQLKRLEIAKSLATKPKLLLLDEVMAGVNDAERDGLVKIIRHIQSKGISILIIGHEVQAILKVTDRLAVINFGEKIAEGLPQDVICDPDVVEAYLGSEYELA